MARTKSKTKVARDYHQIILTTVAVFGLLVAATPAYWSYLCRSSGKYCEGSFASPSTGPEVREKVAAQITTEAGQKNYNGLSVREGGVWPSSRRLDIVARFRDGSETAIDSVPSDGVTEIYSNPKDDLVALIGRTEDGGGARITAYFPSLQLAKRVFDIASFSSQYDVKIRNFAFDAPAKTMRFDVEASSQWLSVNKNEATTFSIGEETSVEKRLGATVSLELTDTLHVKSIYDQSKKDAFEVAQKQVEECVNDAKALPGKIDGEVFGCWLRQTGRLTSRNGSVLVYEWRGGELKLVSSEPCDMCYWTKGSNRKTIFVSRDEARKRKPDGPKRVDIWLSIHRLPFDVERTYFIEGDCGKFNPWDIDDADSRTISFRLDTDCASAKINNKELKFRNPDQKGVEITEMYQLKIDDKGMLLALVLSK